MTNASLQNNASRSPSHVAYHVRPGTGKGFWNRVGVAWTNRDGGFTVQLDTLPLDGRIVCQPADKKPE
jgi:hypothetical protein